MTQVGEPGNHSFLDFVAHGSHAGHCPYLHTAAVSFAGDVSMTQPELERGRELSDCLPKLSDEAERNKSASSAVLREKEECFF